MTDSIIQLHHTDNKSCIAVDFITVSNDSQTSEGRPICLQERQDASEDTRTLEKGSSSMSVDKTLNVAENATVKGKNKQKLEGRNISSEESECI